MLFPFQPESPLTERLRFLSDISVHKDGSEQRVCLRKGPRQEFDFDILVENDERQKMENRFFGAQVDEWDVPVWFEPMYLDSNPTAGATTMTILSHDVTDFRAGNKVLIWRDETENEVIENCTYSAGTLTTDTALTRDYPQGTPLYVLRPAKMTAQARVARYPVNMTKYSVTFRVTDNDIDLADIAGWDTIGGIPLLNDANFMSDTLTEGWDRQVFVTDGNTGTFETLSFWDRSRRLSTKGFKSFDRARLWKFRKLLHWMKGRQKAFYLPTNAPELTASANLAMAGTTINVVNAGYTTFTDSREPRNIIRVALRNGTVYTKSISDAVEIDADTEQLTVDTGWAANVDVSDILRIDIVEKVRSDADDMTIVHLDNLGQAEISIPVKTVLE